MAICRLLLVTLSFCLLFGADEKKPEMTHYVMGLLRKGPNWTAAVTEETQRLQEGHMANIRKMASTGKLVVAGPFTDNGETRGVFIFRLISMEEARAMMDQDPAVKAGRLVVELHPWFAAAGLSVSAPK